MSLFGGVFDFVDDIVTGVTDIFGEDIFGDIAEAGLKVLDNKKDRDRAIMNRPSRNLFGLGSEVGIGSITSPGLATGVKSVDIDSVYSEWNSRLTVLSGEYDDALKGQ